MLSHNGCQKLREFTERSYKKTVMEVTSGVWFVLGYGHSNAIFIEGQTSVILIDTLDSRERGDCLKFWIQRRRGSRSGLFSIRMDILTTGAEPEPFRRKSRKSSRLNRKIRN